MRIIARSTLERLSKNHQTCVQSLRAWIQEVENANWSSSGELKKQFGNASIINSKRVVFNIKDNNFRLIVDIEYRLKIVFIVWFGTHKEYDKIDVKKIRYDSSNKK
ncbi:MAG TPA: type II toxin-antitoxin system HigB family toxin [Bacteroidetes bacterium]|nr:type II toxin-antitoxin system HigB family toxin [Bacteroidota bacterium]